MKKNVTFPKTNKKLKKNITVPKTFFFLYKSSLLASDDNIPGVSLRDVFRGQGVQIDIVDYLVADHEVGGGAHVRLEGQRAGDCLGKG